MDTTSQDNYIQNVQVNLFGGIFSGTINFQPGLNIIAGANGTGKTQLLNHILSQRSSENVKFFDTSKPKDIAAFCPKRNAEKRAIEQAHQIILQDQNAKVSTLKAIKNINIQDNNYQTIKSISEYLITQAEYINRKGESTLPQAYQQVQDSYQTILEKIFDYKINFSWDSKSTKPVFTIRKLDYELSSQQLSSGENALISLIFAIFDAREEVQVYLIDEPEVHLNWQLEEKLFLALDWFCEEYGKQAIIVTHSRACFIDPFIKKTQFLIWEDGKIKPIQQPDDTIRETLAGDIVRIIGGITTENKIAYVEDKVCSKIFKKIKELKGCDIEISILTGGCGEVKKYSEVFKHLKIENAYFIIDNDNNPISSTDLSTKYLNLIQLKKYCIENYFLDETVLGEIDARSDKSKGINDLIKEAIKQVDNPYFVVYKKLIDSNIELDNEILDKIDASKFIRTLAKDLGYSDKNDFFDKYLEKLNEINKLEEVFSDFWEALYK